MEKLKNLEHLLAVKAVDLDVEEMLLPVVKKNRKWLQEIIVGYNKLNKDIGKSSSGHEEEVQELQRRVEEAISKMDKIVQGFEQQEKGASAKVAANQDAEITQGSAEKKLMVTQGAAALAPSEQTANESNTQPRDQAISREQEKPVSKLRRKFELKYRTITRKLEVIESRLPTANKSYLNMQWLALQSEYGQLESIVEIIIDDDDEDDLDMIEAWDCIRERYVDVCVEIEERVETMQNTGSTSLIRLEELKVPIFSGYINDWNSFKEIFTKLVEEDRRLSEVEKFYRLKSVVKGDAARLIQHLQVTGENYSAAWKILEQRYDNRRLLFCTLFDKIIDHGIINIQYSNSIKQLLDTATESLHALKAMGMKVDEADPFIARILIRKLDKEGLLKYEQWVQKSKEVQRLEDVLSFLEQQYLALEAVYSKKGNTHQRAKTTQSYQTTQRSCAFCQASGHGLKECYKFLKLQPAEKGAWAQKMKMCKICLSHPSEKKCFKFNTKCEKCGGKHITMLHVEGNKTQETQRSNSKAQLIMEGNAVTLLATAQIRVKAASGEQILMRALIDQGSQRTSISEEAAQILRLPRKKLVTDLVGLGNTTVGRSKAIMQIEIKPRFESDAVHVIDAMVLSTLSSAQPDRNLNVSVESWRNYCLADPLFYKSDRIDLLIGADLYHEIIQEGVVKIGSLSGQETSLGLIICGCVCGHEKGNAVMAVTKELERFWEMEEVCEDDDVKEDRCEQLFTTTTTINEDKRLVVRLPFKEDIELGASRKMALARFLNLEKRLEKDEKLQKQYCAFMKEYLEMGHMKKVSKRNSGKYYLPHQAVIRESHLTTKVRVVFDASAKTSNGKSLNDVLEIGPKLQQDIFQILLKWRLWRFVLVADVEKMYRQVLVADKDQSYQCILWRENKHMPIEEFALTTVTYGTACAPFLAKRALIEIGKECSERNPKIQAIIENDFYMDDLMTGADSVQECIGIHHDISQQLDKFGFKLRKWMSNENDILEAIPNVGENEVIRIEEGETMKTLGVQWDPHTDNFAFYFQIIEDNKLTKRKALSTLAKIYDPLGWLAPVTILAKLFIQRLWVMDMAWDDQLSSEMIKEWDVIMRKLPDLAEIRIPRWLSTSSLMEIELHGFADASEKAYAAVIYIRAANKVTLVAAKSKVNPVKNRKTLPKLELCAAHLLAKLMLNVEKLIVQKQQKYLWSDSTIALAWIAKAENIKDKFVRVRVEEIKKSVPGAVWGHVRSKENPADAASRGMKPELLKGDELWWSGPHWLLEKNNWPISTVQPFVGVLKENKQEDDVIMQLITRISSYKKLIRIIAYVRRFIERAQRKPGKNELTAEEINEAEQLIITSVQANQFSLEISCLRNGSEVPTRSKICGLTPFIDAAGVLRVGGRLENSGLSFNRKHPILLGKGCLVDRIIDGIHTETLHGGAKLMENELRSRYWVIGAKNAIKRAVRSCVKCLRYRRETAAQLMGNLPESRVCVSHPFDHTGIDYAGPIQMKVSKGRGQRAYKGYIAVFVCMATKALHLEAVSDLTTEAFLAALRRFFSRRGKSSHIYSDNGTNFVGAARHLDKEFVKAVQQNSDVAHILASERIQWHFIPPGAPHFGGLWEAAVKSVKHHLRRVVGETKLTYEEMATFLSQIEAVLNSRPLCPLSEDNCEILTPGHFVVGRPLLSIPERGVENKLGSLDRWKIIQRMRDDFWKQWRNDYLSSLQQRVKWKTPVPNIKVGQMVIVRDENTAPGRWPLGSIAEVHKGKDGKVRVATVKVAKQKGLLKRPIHKLCPLEIFANGGEKEADIEVSQTYICKLPQRRKINVAMMLWMIMAMMASVQSMSTSITGGAIKELGNDTIIYMDKIGRINRVTSSWNLMTYFDLHGYFVTVNHLDKGLEACKSLCVRLRSFEQQCDTQMDIMTNRLNTIDENHLLLSHKKRQRNKRAPLEFVGSLFHILFGVMDADDRESMEANMKNVLENQHNLKYLAEKQTSVVEATLNVLKKTTDEINGQFKELNEKVQNISQMLNTDYSLFKKAMDFFAVADQLSSLFTEVEHIQARVIGLLIDINHGKVNPNLVRPNQLQAEVMKIKDQLPKGLRLPGEKDNVLQAIYKVMTAHGLLVEEKLVIDVQIPLVEKSSAEIFRVVPLPMVRNGTAMVAALRQQFLAYNYEMDAYHLLSQSLMNQCQLTGEDEFLCRGNWAWEDANDHSCELAALKPTSKYGCQFLKTQNRNFWIELKTRGSWLFKTKDQVSAHILCAERTKGVFELPGLGIITLQPGCTARIGRTVLTASQEAKTEMSYNSTSYILREVKDIAMVDELNYNKIDHSSTIQGLEEEIKMMKANPIHLKELSWHHISGHISLILIILFLSYVIYKYLTRESNIVVVRPRDV